MHVSGISSLDVKLIFAFPLHNRTDSRLCVFQLAAQFKEELAEDHLGAGGAIANRDIRNFKDGPKLRICVNFDHKTLNMVFFSSIEKIFYAFSL